MGMGLLLLQLLVLLLMLLRVNRVVGGRDRARPRLVISRGMRGGLSHGG